MRERRRVFAQQSLKLAQIRFRAFDFNKHAVAFVADKPA
jgi:hypothetical protein